MTDLAHVVAPLPSPDVLTKIEADCDVVIGRVFAAVAADYFVQTRSRAGRVSTQHTAAGLAARVCYGMPADLLWRAGERRPIRRLDLANLAIDRNMDRRMRLVGRGVVLAAVACFVPIAVGLPALLVVTLPSAALLARQRPRGDVTQEIALVLEMLPAAVGAVGVGSEVCERLDSRKYDGVVLTCDRHRPRKRATQ